MTRRCWFTAWIAVLSLGSGQLGASGGKIAFISNRDGEFDIFVMAADGSNPTRLTRDPGRDGAPSWSPDGRQIAFETDRTGDFEVFAMGVDGSGLVNLTQRPDANDGFPVWHPVMVASCVRMVPWGKVKAAVLEQLGATPKAP